MVFNICGMMGAYLFVVGVKGVDPGIFIHNIRWYTDMGDLLMGVIKAVVFGSMVALIGCHQGYHASGGARGVGLATMRAVVICSVAILIDRLRRDRRADHAGNLRRMTATQPQHDDEEAATRSARRGAHQIQVRQGLRRVFWRAPGAAGRRPRYRARAYQRRHRGLGRWQVGADEAPDRAAQARFEGQILVDGDDIVPMNEFRLNEVRTKFGMLFQYAALFDSMTVEENVIFPLVERRRRELSRSQMREMAREKLQALGLFNVEKKYPAELSGGMRKRVGSPGRL
jgi:energy-coupling factor transporter ATP-binding protein EcfA2